ncbi:hypothetical protein FRB99_006166 [Tulasnella sp. 403]|nr:hypothetical protein FRB99_006166 [Tulasnella sp. 403]
MKSFAASLSFFALSLIPSALAHGHLASVAIDGKTFAGPDVNKQLPDTPIRGINSVSPIRDVTSDDMACGRGAATAGAPQAADAKPGSVMEFNWVGGGKADSGRTWSHKFGPLITYIASCSGSCSSFDATQAKWVKIQETGLLADNSWAQLDELHAGKPLTVKLPDNLPDGEHLVRQEIIALHNVGKTGAESYPSCTQINISGGQGQLPDGGVSFPGAYKADDPGLTFNPFKNKTGPYEIPGGPVLLGPDAGADPTPADPTVTDTVTSSVADATGTITSDIADATDSASTPTETKTKSKKGKKTKTSTVIETATVTVSADDASSTADEATTSVVDGAADVPTETPSAGDDYRPKRRSRIMGRRHYSAMH